MECAGIDSFKASHQVECAENSYVIATLVIVSTLLGVYLFDITIRLALWKSSQSDDNISQRLRTNDRQQMIQLQETTTLVANLALALRDARRPIGEATKAAK